MAKITVDIIGAIILNCGLPEEIKYMTYSHGHNTYDRTSNTILNTHYILFNVMQEVLVLSYDEELACLLLPEDETVKHCFDLKTMILNPIEHYRPALRTFILGAFDKVLRERKEIG
jgi:hypothetical protein